MSKAPKKKDKKAGKKLKNVGQLIELLSGNVPKGTLIAAIDAAAAAAIAELKAAAPEPEKPEKTAAPKGSKKVKKKGKDKPAQEAGAAVAPDDSADSHE